MNLAPRTKLAVFFYGLLALSVARGLEHSNFQLVGLGWLQVGAWTTSFCLIPWLFRIPQMFLVWGWLSLLGCIITIASRPLVVAQPWPWTLYLGDVFITALGAYLFLLDRSVERYASALQNRSANSEPGASSNDGPARPHGSSSVTGGPPSVS